MKNSGFTLIELLAVIAILAIILLIAVPMALSTVSNAKKTTFKSDTKMILKAIDIKMASDRTFDPTTITVSNINDLLGIDSTKYQSVKIVKVGKELYIKTVGQGKYSDLVATGNYEAITVALVSEAGNDSLLSNISIPGVTLNTPFSKNTFNYTATVNNVGSINIVATSGDIVTLNCTNNNTLYSMTNGNATAIPLVTGTNTIVITSTSIFGNISTYTLVITNLSIDVSLTSLLLKYAPRNGFINPSPTFSPGNYGGYLISKSGNTYIYMGGTPATDTTASVYFNGSLIIPTLSSALVMIPISVGDTGSIVVKSITYPSVFVTYTFSITS